MAKIIRMKKTKPKRRAKVIDITERRGEAMDLVKFIDAHGGRLGAFRGYQVRPHHLRRSSARLSGRSKLSNHRYPAGEVANAPTHHEGEPRRRTARKKAPK